jgi:SMC interacting uncharacterized protein involved in chromosome segregation
MTPIEKAALAKAEVEAKTFHGLWQDTETEYAATAKFYRGKLADTEERAEKAETAVSALRAEIDKLKDTIVTQDIIIKKCMDDECAMFNRAEKAEARLRCGFGGCTEPSVICQHHLTERINDMAKRKEMDAEARIAELEKQRERVVALCEEVCRTEAKTEKHFGKQGMACEVFRIVEKKEAKKNV